MGQVHLCTGAHGYRCWVLHWRPCWAVDSRNRPLLRYRGTGVEPEEYAASDGSESWGKVRAQHERSG